MGKLTGNFKVGYKNGVYPGNKTKDEKKKAYKSIDGVKLESIFLYGDPANQIIDYSNNNRVDLIVMGSNGLQGIAKFKGLGSVSRKVSEAVSCPITIIR